MFSYMCEICGSNSSVYGDLVKSSKMLMSCETVQRDYLALNIQAQRSFETSVYRHGVISDKNYMG